MGQSLNLSDLWNIFRRRFWILAIVGIIGVLAGSFVTMILPRMYETSAKILVESQQIPTDLARSTVNSSAAERLQIIEQRLMARDNLVTLIEEHGLFGDRPDMILLDKIDALRDATWITSTGASGSRGGSEISAFTINVRLSDPNKAAVVANEFVSNVLDQNLQARTERARQTLQFFDAESDRLSREISTAESEISAFKGENEDALPDSLEFRRSELARLQDTGFEIATRIFDLEDDLSALEAELEIQTPSPANLTAEEQELKQLRSALAEKRLSLADVHPDIRRLKNRITAIETTLGVEGTDEEESSPIARQRNQTLRRQIELMGNQIELLEAQKQSMTDREEELRASIDRTPGVQIQLNALERRQAELLDQYSVVTRKRVEAETGQRLEMDQQAERFEVIENALVPQDPVSPNKKKILALAVAASGALGLAIVALCEMLNPALRTSAQMERVLGLHPVVSIPRIRTHKEQVNRKLGWAFATIVVLAGLPAATWFVDQHVMPVQAAAEKVADKSGLTEMLWMVKKRF